MGTQRSKLEILIESILHGTGFQDAEKGMEGAGSAADIMARQFEETTASSHRLVRAEAAQTQAANRLRDAQKTLAEYTGKLGPEAQRDLEKAVIDAKEALEAAERETRDSKKALADLSGEATAAGGRFQKFGLTLVDIKAGLDMAMGAARTLAGAIQGVYDTAREGAMLNRTADAFGNLSGSAWLAYENLESVKAATDRTITSADAMAAATKLMGMGLADNADELAETTVLAVRLGRAFGRDATTALEEFGLMLANQSVERLDTFGISSGKVRVRIEELKQSGLDAEKAFKQATLLRRGQGGSGHDGRGSSIHLARDRGLGGLTQAKPC